MTREQGLPAVPTLAARQEERAERILAAAEELLLRYGYNRVTIADIAKRAGIGKGTIYLHWTTREALFGTLFLREVVALWRALIERVRADPAEVRFHRVMRAMLLTAMSRPLARALFTGDRELLGKLAERGFARPPRALTDTQSELLALLRDNGLLRADIDQPQQRYALRATVTGFLVTQALPEGETLPLEARADALAETIQRAFEPPEQLPDAVLPVVAAQLLSWLDRLCATVEVQIATQMRVANDA
jgi:AcrR family transcriptional regulator